MRILSFLFLVAYSFPNAVLCEVLCRLYSCVDCCDRKKVFWFGWGFSSFCFLWYVMFRTQKFRSRTFPSAQDSHYSVVEACGRGVGREWVVLGFCLHSLARAPRFTSGEILCMRSFFFSPHHEVIRILTSGIFNNIHLAYCCISVLLCNFFFLCIRWYQDSVLQFMVRLLNFLRANLWSVIPQLVNTHCEKRYCSEMVRNKICFQKIHSNDEYWGGFCVCVFICKIYCIEIVTNNRIPTQVSK